MALIKLENITRNFKNGEVKTEVLKGINIEVEQGEFLSIMGPSGSGKSTLLNILGCLDKPTSGMYFLDNKQVDKLNDNKLAEIRNHRIGFVFQGFHLMPSLDAQANVELPLIYRGMGSKKRHKLSEEALDAVGLLDRKTHKPSQLSGGEQQRVAIARAIASGPDIIFADEPTGALDSQNGNNIMEIFQKLNKEKGMTIVQVTHQDNIARYSNRIIYILDGQVNKEDSNLIN